MSFRGRFPMPPQVGEPSFRAQSSWRSVFRPFTSARSSLWPTASLELRSFTARWACLDAHAVALFFGPNHCWLGATERRALASGGRGQTTALRQTELVHSALDAPPIDWHAAAP